MVILRDTPIPNYFTFIVRFSQSQNIAIKQSLLPMKSKVYSPNFLYMIQPYDKTHDKVWKDEETLNVEVYQKKQIDRILHGVIKQRLFGEIFVEKDKKLSKQCYHTLEHISRSQMHMQNNFTERFTHRDKTVLSPRKRLTFITQAKSLNRSKTRSLKSYGLSQYHNNKNSIRPKDRKREVSPSFCNLPSIECPESERDITVLKNKRKSSIIMSPEERQKLKEIYRKQSEEVFSISKVDNFVENFRHMTENYSTPLIFEVKISKEKLIKYSSEVLPGYFIDRLYDFFNLPNVQTYRQYCKNVETIMNTELGLINFFLFTIFDYSGNGFLTVSDLFRMVQHVPENKSLENELFKLRESILSVTERLESAPQKQRYIKPTVRELLIPNHSLNVFEIRQLLKKEKNTDKIHTVRPKLSTYHQSIMILEHDSRQRQKRGKLENAKAKKASSKNTLGETKFSEVQDFEKSESWMQRSFSGVSQNSMENSLPKEKRQFELKGMLLQQGMRFEQFDKVYSENKSELWKLLSRCITGTIGKQSD